MKKYIDEATGIFFLAFIWFIFILLGIVKKDLKLFSIFLFGGAFLLFLYFLHLKYKSTAQIVKNEFDNSVKYLDEHGNLKELSARGTVSGVDGINTCTHPDKIFKAHNGVNLKITSTGDVKEVNFLSRLYNRSGGGWVGKDFFSEYELLSQWQQLFDVCVSG